MDTAVVLSVLFGASGISAIAWNLATDRFIFATVAAALTATTVAYGIFWALLGESPHWYTLATNFPINAVICAVCGVPFIWRRKRNGQAQ